MNEEIATETPVKKNKGGRPRKAAAVPAAAQTGISPDMAALIAALTKAQIDGPKAQAEAFAKIQNPSNVVSTGRSAFNPRGNKLDDYQMPELKCEIHAPHPLHPAYHGLDREEVELFNLLEPGEYRITLTDDSMAKMTVKAIRNDVTGRIEKMRIESGWTDEHKGKYPGARVWLREILGAKANGVMTMKQELSLIEAGELSVSV